MQAVLIRAFGGPEVLEVTDVPEPRAAEGQTVVDVTAAGINYADTMQTRDAYLAPTPLPLIPGLELVGLTPGGRRVVALVPNGAYAERAAVSDALMWDVPDTVGDEQALALAVQGTTAWHVLHTSARLAPGESVVVHAGAGGVGHLAIQLARRAKASRVIGVASGPAKRELMLRLGADAAIDAGADDLTAAIREANGGRQVDVVLEMVGGRTFSESLAAVAPFGRLVTFGIAGSDPPPPVDPLALMRASCSVVGFWIARLTTEPARIGGPLRELFGLVAARDLEVLVGGQYALDDVARAHRDMRARTTTGKLVLTPAGAAG